MTVCLCSFDSYKVFAEPVSASEMPEYYETIESPMDFGTMRRKAETKEYGVGSEAAAAFFDDFLLVFDNCRLFNTDDSEVTEEATRLLGLLPEAFVAACITFAKREL